MYYDNAYQISLNSGRTIVLRNLFQSMTYESQLEGWPHFNTCHIERDRKWAENRFQCPAVVADARKHPMPVFEHEIRELTRHPLNARRQLFSLHRVACVAYFISMSAPGSAGVGISELAMVWYQEHFCMPIDPMVLEKIQALDWDELAQDYEF